MAGKKKIGSFEAVENEIMDMMAQLSPGEMELLQKNMGEWLEKGELWENEAEAAIDEAQALIFDAWDSPRVDRRIKLAREAIAISDCCADGFLILADDASANDEERLDHIKQAVAAGERAIKVYGHEDEIGHFWGLLETRPYMRALQHLALEHRKHGRLSEAAEILKHMLHLNPNDNLGVRYILLHLHLQMSKAKDAQKLMAKYGDDHSAYWFFGKTLLYVLRGKNAAASLQAANAYNPHVVAYLNGKKKIPKRLPDMHGIGDESEAMIYANDCLPAWKAVAGALDWLKAETAGNR